MRVREVVTGVDGQQFERWIDMPDVITAEQQAPIDAANAQQDANGQTLQQQASDALANLRAYRDLASPTNAQTVATVKLLTRVAIGLIRLYLRKFDATD